MEQADAIDEVTPEDRFDALYRSEYRRAVQLAHLLTGANDAAGDIAQDAFVRIRAKLDEIERPEAYLRTTVTHLCWNWQRARGRDRERRLRAASGTPLTVGHLLGIVDRLPFRQRTVLVSRYWLDLSEAEIAALVGCRPGTVKSLAARALRALRKELA